jgi:hypothetical protein
MAKTTKRINGDYDVITNDGSSGNITLDTNTVIITGNLTVTGTQTTVNTTDTNLEDNVIVLNSGETGDGVTLGVAGLSVDRGTPDGSTLNDTANFTFNEADDAWEATLGSSYTIMRSADPDSVSPGGNDVVTVNYLSGLGIGGGTVTVDKIIEGDSKAEIVDTGGSERFFIEINSTEVFNLDTTSMDYANVSISGNTISNNATDEDLTLSVTGAGELVINPVITLPEQVSDPSSAVGETRIYAKTPAGGGSGVFVANQDTTDELVTKSKAIVFGLIF